MKSQSCKILEYFPACYKHGPDMVQKSRESRHSLIYYRFLFKKQQYTSKIKYLNNHCLLLTLSEVASTLTLAPVTKLSTIRLRAGQGLELSLECVQGMFFSADYSDVLIAYKEFPRNQKWLPQD